MSDIIDKIYNISISYSQPGFFTILWNPVENISYYNIYYTDKLTNITSIIDTITPFITLNIPLNNYKFKIEGVVETEQYSIYSDTIEYNVPYIFDIKNKIVDNKLYISWSISGQDDITGYTFYNNGVKFNDILMLSNTSAVLYLIDINNYNVSLAIITEFGEVAAVAVDSRGCAAFASDDTASVAAVNSQTVAAARSFQLPIQQQQQQQLANRQIPQVPETPIITYKNTNKNIKITINNYNSSYNYTVYEYNKYTTNYIPTGFTQIKNRLFITNLLNGQEFRYRIYAVNSNIFSEPAEIITYPKTVPRAPLIVHTYTGDSTALLNINPTDNGGSTIEDYIIHLYNSSFSLTLIDNNSLEYYNYQNPFILQSGSMPDIIPYITVNKDNKTIQINNLINNIVYNIQVLATNEAGTGYTSKEIRVQPLSAPQPPVITTIRGSMNSLIVEWYADINVDPPIRGYILYWKHISSTSNYDGSIQLDNQIQTTYTIRNLMNNNKYTVFISAYNDYGISIPSEFREGIPYDPNNSIVSEVVDINNIIPVTTIYNNPYLTFDYVKKYIDTINTNTSVTFTQVDSVFSVLNIADIQEKKIIFPESVLFKSFDNKIWIYNLIHPTFRQIASSIIIVTTSQNRRYQNAVLPAGLRIIDINQYDTYENLIVPNADNKDTYSFIEFEINEPIDRLYIYKEFGDTLLLLLDFNTKNIQEKGQEKINSTYTGITGKFKYTTDGRSRFEYTGPVTRLILSYSQI